MRISDKILVLLILSLYSPFFKMQHRHINSKIFPLSRFLSVSAHGNSIVINLNTLWLNHGILIFLTVSILIGFFFFTCEMSALFMNLHKLAKSCCSCQLSLPIVNVCGKLRLFWMQFYSFTSDINAWSYRFNITFI